MYIYISIYIYIYTYMYVYIYTYKYVYHKRTSQECPKSRTRRATLRGPRFQPSMQAKNNQKIAVKNDKPCAQRAILNLR